MMFSVYGVNSTFVSVNDNIHLASDSSNNDLLCFQLDAEDFEDEQVSCNERNTLCINNIISHTLFSAFNILLQPKFTFLQPPILL